MEQKNFTVVSVIVFLLALVLMLFVEDRLFIGFIWLVVFAYHLIAYYNYKAFIKEEMTQDKKRLLYTLDQTKKETQVAATQFVSLSNVINSGLVLIDENETIKQVNDTFEFAFNLADLQDKKYAALKSIKRLYKAIDTSFIKEDKHREQIEFNHHFYDVNITPIFKGKMYRGCLVVIHDVTQLKTAETFQKQFTADVSHELKTPLSAIKGIAEIMVNTPSMSEVEKQDFIETIYHESTRLETILNDLLIISKMDRLDYELDLKKTNMKPLIEDAIRLLSPLAKEKKLDVSHDLADQEMYVDAIKFRQVIINLIKNALTYTNVGHVDITSEVKDATYIIRVTDTGIGIKEEDKENIFKRFYRVDDNRSRASGGSGLGLSIIKNVVLKHEGELDLVSTVGKGSCFIVKVPIIQELH